MNRHRQLKTEACLLLFDPHLDVAWMRGVLERERGGASHLLLGGDYFDAARPAKVGTAGQMCELLYELAAEWGDRLTVLLGNHDIHYLEAKYWFDQGIAPPSLRYQTAGFDYEAAKSIAQLLPVEFWSGCRLFQVVNGWLVSHAGLAGSFWHPHVAEAAALEALDEHCQIALERVAQCTLPILQSGRARGGERELGGITWLDFNFEFSDTEVSLPQVVGHTTSSRGGARSRGRSWCLDGSQTCYGILREDGQLSVVNPPT